MHEEKIVIELGKKMAVLTVKPFDGDIDVEGILQIDYSNLMGEILTYPVLFNRIGNMQADMVNIVAEAKLDLDIYEAQLREEHQKRLNAAGEKRATKEDIATAVLRDERFSKKTKTFLRLERDLGYINSLYWSAKSKDGKLDKISDKLRPSEFEGELLQDTINGVMIKTSKKFLD